MKLGILQRQGRGKIGIVYIQGRGKIGIVQLQGRGKRGILQGQGRGHPGAVADISLKRGHHRLQKSNIDWLQNSIGHCVTVCTFPNLPARAPSVKRSIGQ
jgi:hypothetical protein